MTIVKDLSPVARPANAEPWKRKSQSQIVSVALAASLPAVLTWAITSLAQLDLSVAVVLLFLPLQLIAAGIVGVRIFGRRGIAESALIVSTILLSLMVAGLLLSVLWSVISAGAQTISWTFLSQNNVYISPTTSLEYGGVGHSILGTLLIVGLTTLVTVPFGKQCASPSAMNRRVVPSPSVAWPRYSSKVSPPKLKPWRQGWVS